MSRESSPGSERGSVKSVGYLILSYDVMICKTYRCNPSRLIKSSYDININSRSSLFSFYYSQIYSVEVIKLIRKYPCDTFVDYSGNITHDVKNDWLDPLGRAIGSYTITHWFPVKDAPTSITYIVFTFQACQFLVFSWLWSYMYLPLSKLLDELLLASQPIDAHPLWK